MSFMLCYENKACNNGVDYSLNNFHKIWKKPARRAFLWCQFYRVHFTMRRVFN